MRLNAAKKCTTKSHATESFKTVLSKSVYFIENMERMELEERCTQHRTRGTAQCSRGKPAGAAVYD